MKPQKKDEKEIIVSSSSNRDIADLRSKVNIEIEKRKIIKEYIEKHLKEGVDYGSIEITSKTGKTYTSKPTLFKAGSEKFISLMHLTPVFSRDNETWEMMGSEPGIICYLCKLLTEKGILAGEGRGAADVSSEGTVNKAIKIAEKRAQLDAVLRTGTLSDFFTQDMEDQSERDNAMAGYRSPASMQSATEKQIALLSLLMEKKGKDKQQIYNIFKVDSLAKLNIQQASKLIEKLQSLPDKVVQSELPTPEEEEELDSQETIEDNKEPALNFQIAWVKSHMTILLDNGIITPEQQETISMLTQGEVAEIMKAYKDKNLHLEEMY